MRQPAFIRLRRWPQQLWLLAACGGLLGCSDRTPQPASEAASGSTPRAGGSTAATAVSGAASPPTATTTTTATATATATAKAPAAAASIAGRIVADGPALTFALFTAPESPAGSGVLAVRSIEIRNPDGGLLQRIEGLDTQTPWSEQFRGLELVDLDFDGFADLRIVESQAAGPGLPYRNWRYDTATRRFVAAPELDPLPGLQVDPENRELRSSWRDGPTRYGVDIWTYRDAALVPLRRERREYSRPGVFTLEVSRLQSDGSWKLTEKRQGRDP